MAKPIVEMTPEMRKMQRELANELAMMRHRLMQAGLLLTHHAIERAVVAIGHEIAAMENGTWPESAMKAIDERFKEQSS